MEKLGLLVSKIHSELSTRTPGAVDKAFELESTSEGNYLEVAGSIPITSKTNKEYLQ